MYTQAIVPPHLQNARMVNAHFTNTISLVPRPSNCPVFDCYSQSWCHNVMVEIWSNSFRSSPFYPITIW